MKDRIKHYLANGLKASEVASVLGCSPAYISQLLKNEDFKKEVEAAMLDNQAPASDRLDVKYESLEHAIIGQMQSAVIGAELPHLSKALEAITKAQDVRHKMRNPALVNGPQLVQQVVNITLPAHALQVPALTLNEKSEVIAIDSRPMASMTSSGVKNLFSQLGAKNANAALQGNPDPTFQIPAYDSPATGAAS